MPVDNYQSQALRYGKPVIKTGLVVSSGATDGGRLVATGPDGVLDESVLPASASSFTLTALANSGSSISGDRVIKANGDGSVSYADCSVSGDGSKAIGITTTAASAGASLNYQAQGTVSYSGWSWVPGPVYLSTSGQLTQTAPTSGFVLVVGVAITATKLQVGVGIPIVLV